MATHPGMLIAYDVGGRVTGTLSYVVRYDDSPERLPLGLVDFASHEEAGGEHLDVWNVEDARGSKVWPEWLGASAHDFKVELEGPPGRKRIAALVHKQSGHRRERAVIEEAITARIAAAPEGEPADIRDLVGGPDRPILLDAEGRTKARVVVERPVLPLASARQRVDTAPEQEASMPPEQPQ